MSFIKFAKDLDTKFLLNFTNAYFNRDMAFINFGKNWDSLKKMIDVLHALYNIDYVGFVIGNKNVCLYSYSNEKWQDKFIELAYWERGLDFKVAALYDMKSSDNNLFFWEAIKHVEGMQIRAEIFGEFKRGCTINTYNEKNDLRFAMSVTFDKLDFSLLSRKKIRKMVIDMMDAKYKMIPYLKSFEKDRTFNNVAEFSKDMPPTIFD